MCRPAAHLRDAEIEGLSKVDKPLHFSDVVGAAPRAFMAYQQPVLDPLWTESHSCHLDTVTTTTRYVDRGFVAAVHEAAVAVFVHNAEHLSSGGVRSPPCLLAFLLQSGGLVVTCWCLTVQCTTCAVG